MIKKVLSNILVGIVVAVSGYLLIANIMHIVYLNQYGTYNFNDEQFVNYKNKIKDLDTNAEKLKNGNFNFKKEDLENLIIYTDEVLNAIKNNKFLEFTGEQKFYLKDIYKINWTDFSSHVQYNTLINILNILITYDDTLKSYRDLMITIWASKMYSSNEQENLPLTASYYMTINPLKDTINPSIIIRANIYNLMNNIEELNYMYELIMKVGNANEE